MIVIVDLAGVQRHPQPNPLLPAMHHVVLAQRPCQLNRQHIHKQALGHLGRNQNENTVTPIFVVTAGPRDGSIAEGLPQGSIHTVAHRDLMRIFPMSIPEPLHIHASASPYPIVPPPVPHAGADTVEARTPARIPAIERCRLHR